MTVAVEFTADRSSSTVGIGPVGTVQPTLRASGPVIDIPNANNVTVPWPAGTVAGDLALIATSNGYQTNVPAGWTQLQRDNQSNWNGAIFYKVLTAGDITAGSVNVTFTNSYSGCAAIATYQDGANLTVALVDYDTSTGGVSSFSYPYGALAAYLYFVFGSCRANGNITFAVATKVDGFNSAAGASPHSAALALYAPGADASVSEAINYAATGSGTYGAVVSITKNAGTKNRLVNSNALSAASESIRWAVGPLYFEAKLAAKAGTPSVGLVNYQASFGAATLGTSVNSIAYNSDGTVKINNVTLATISAYNAGDVVCMAYHPALKLIWFRVNNGSWNNDGTANPATFVNGIDVSTFSADRAFPAVGFSVAGSTFIANFATADFAYSNPTGYNSVEEAVVTVAYTVEDPADAYADPSEFPDDIGEWNVKGDLGTDNFSRTVAFPAGPVKTIAGEVQEEGVGVEGRLVRLYNRSTGELVGEFRSNGSGDFVIPAADPTARHFVVAFDDDISPDYNAKIYDNVIPQ
jgi:hypothetical protein